MNLILLGFLVSLVAGITTSLGAIPVLFSTRAPQRLLDIMLGFAAGVMLAVTAFGLFIPAIEIGGIWVTLVGFVIGALFLTLLEHLAPHIHYTIETEAIPPKLNKARLLVIAVAIHNFPEGLSLGVGFGTEDIGAATALAIAIGLHNIPEGMAVALPLAQEGHSSKKILLYTTLTGLVQPIGGIIGVSAVILANFLLPYGLSFAAGAMLFVVFDKLIPESHREGHYREATLGGMSGFGLMMLLEATLA